MKAKNKNPASRLSNKNTYRLLEVFYEVNHLKQLFRQGWLRKIPRETCESVAEHTFGVAIIAWLLAEEHFSELDLEKVVKLALIHDIGEVYAGDMTPADEITPDEKHRLEFDSLQKIFSKLPNGDRYIALWEEYDAGTSPEAWFVKQVDRLEMALQAEIYEQQSGANLQDFFNSASKAIELPELKKILQEIESHRNR